MSKYKDYSTSTARYMTAVEKFLKEKYGEVGSEWQQPLIMLADNIELHTMSKKSIKENGLMMQAKNGAMTKNPLVKVMIDTQSHIYRLFSEFGLTPKAQSKISLASDDDDELKELMGE